MDSELFCHKTILWISRNLHMELIVRCHDWLLINFGLGRSLWQVLILQMNPGKSVCLSSAAAQEARCPASWSSPGAATVAVRWQRTDKTCISLHQLSWSGHSYHGPCGLNYFCWSASPQTSWPLSTHSLHRQSVKVPLRVDVLQEVDPNEHPWGFLTSHLKLEVNPGVNGVQSPTLEVLREDGLLERRLSSERLLPCSCATTVDFTPMYLRNEIGVTFSTVFFYVFWPSGTTRRCLAIIIFIWKLPSTQDVHFTLPATVAPCCPRKLLCTQRRSWSVCPPSTTSWMNSSTTSESSSGSRRGATGPSCRCWWTPPPVVWTTCSERCRTWGPACREPSQSWLRWRSRASSLAGVPSVWPKVWWWCAGPWRGSASKEGVKVHRSLAEQEVAAAWGWTEELEEAQGGLELWKKLNLKQWSWWQTSQIFVLTIFRLLHHVTHWLVMCSSHWTVEKCKDIHIYIYIHWNIAIFGFTRTSYIRVFETFHLFIHKILQFFLLL